MHLHHRQFDRPAGESSLRAVELEDSAYLYQGVFTCTNCFVGVQASLVEFKLSPWVRADEPEGQNPGSVHPGDLL
jgi:hypothetical protein